MIAIKLAKREDIHNLLCFSKKKIDYSRAEDEYRGRIGMNQGERVIQSLLLGHEVLLRITRWGKGVRKENDL